MDPSLPQKLEYRDAVIEIQLTSTGEQTSMGASILVPRGTAARVALTAGDMDQAELLEKIVKKAKEVVDELLDRPDPPEVFLQDGRQASDEA